MVASTVQCGDTRIPKRAMLWIPQGRKEKGRPKKAYKEGRYNTAHERKGPQGMAIL